MSYRKGLPAKPAVLRRDVGGASGLLTRTRPSQHYQSFDTLGERVRVRLFVFSSVM
jgi:hypothetical protein